MSGKRKVQAEDLYRLKSVVDPQVAPDGKKCLFVITEIDHENDTFSSNIYFTEIDQKSEPVQWTFGKHRNFSPRWSPDGQSIAFISGRSGKNQIFMINTSGGEAQQLTFHPNGASSPVWSPDGTRIAFQMALGQEDSLQGREDKKPKQEKLVPLEVERMKYKFEGKGLWDGRYNHIAVVDIASGKKVQLTNGEHDYQLLSWSPDGKYIAMAADLSDDPDFSFVQDILLYHLDTKEVINLTNRRGIFSSAVWSPDGERIAIIGHEKECEYATFSKIWMFDISEKKLTCLTAGLDINIGDYGLGDLQQDIVRPGILWCEDSRSFYFAATNRGSILVYRGTVEGQIESVLSGRQHVYGLSTGGKSERAVVALSKPAVPGELFVLDTGTGKLDQITHVNGAFMEQVELTDAEPIQLPSRDGWELNGWIMKPAAVHEGHKVPLIVEIHGGPHSMYSNTYYHEFQTHVAKGYALLFINPRGSLGYGQQFANAVRGDNGGKDYEDIMDAVDYALDRYDCIDPDRLGVTGGSYGGFMTSWIIGHTNRFKAAVAQRPITNWISQHGVSDEGYYLIETQLKGSLQNVDELWKRSPLAFADQIETPLLLLHGEQDLRCPIEQSEQLFIALRRQRKTVRFVRFPESDHSYWRSGKPSLRISHLTYITGWFDQYL
ncbi:dipeptidyl aminopeptidase/acylaminoacyl peptidase [Paenibacillus forsythiae]|uniref:Dipeptidyl aminopeptidase/acylaminoacyl peptidase n=1 Tax=Paenibacillus forsythiae TaxID=365616 RepID=A0ABU3H2B8_9BACL|nr:S9 family peptidase [Paenibacillus forsythiae]MDT3424974.1 dipeptidyl aminopeptidase/acylaminoacyl peptidase [Paenibacillus forsythiae]